MKCRVCVDRSCAACRKTKPESSGPLRDGAYPNATVVVRGGKIAAIRPGTSVFHSFNDNCLPTAAADDGAGAVVATATTPTLLQSSDCIAVSGKGNTAAPYKLDPKLNPRDFVCSADGITLKKPYAEPLKIPRGYITSVQSATPDTVAVDVTADGLLTVGITAAGIGLGKTRYSTYVRGSCGGTYPVWVDYADNTFVLRIGVKTLATTPLPNPPGTAPPVIRAPASMVFPTLAAAITAADAVPLVDDCIYESTGNP